jgi:GR25 family glycosyltransferase involved in LPS biosynthesis
MNILIIIIILIILLFLLLQINNFEKFINSNNINYYVIHMEKNTNRIDNIKKNENKLNNHIQIFNAIVGNNVDLTNLSIYEKKLINNFDYRYKGEIGCYLSHLMLLKSLLNNNTGYTVIFEDDFKIIDNNLDLKINNILSSIDIDFDILYLGNLNDNHSNLYKNNIYYIDSQKPLWGTHAYLINNKNIKKIYNTLLNMDKAIDNKIKENFDNKILNGLVIYPILVNQNEIFNSTIR